MGKFLLLVLVSFVPLAACDLVGSIRPSPEPTPAPTIPAIEHLTFQADLSSTVVPAIGTAGTFTRESPVAYYDTVSTLSEAAPGDPAFGFPFAGSTALSTPALQVQGATKNWLLRSEAPASSPWISAGGATAANAQGRFLEGTPGLTFGTIATTAEGQGISQVTMLAAAGRTVTASLFGATASGTLEFTIRIEANGTPNESATSGAYVATETPARFAFTHAFTASAQGFVQVTIETSSAGTLRAGGIQLEESDGGPTGGGGSLARPYAKTAGILSSSEPDSLVYPEGNVSPAFLSRGSLSVWISVPYDFHTLAVDTKKSILASGEDKFGLAFDQAGLKFLYDNALFSVSNSVLENVFHQCVVTWDNSSALGVFRTYFNGSLVTDTTSTRTSPFPSPLYVGSQRAYDAVSSMYLDGLVHKLKFWDVVLTPEEVAQLWDLERTEHGR